MALYRINSTTLKAGDWVQVRNLEEILATLDSRGRLENLPFMPEMTAFCGRRFRVESRAHKTCDTVNKTGGRHLQGAVHLEGVRCDGSGHGGCQAECLIFWKEAWLKPVMTIRDSEMHTVGEPPAECPPLLTENASTTSPSGEACYYCQATALPEFTFPLPWWEWRQYVEDWLSGNVTLRRMLRVALLSLYHSVAYSGIGLGTIMRWLYNLVSLPLWGTLYPYTSGAIPETQRTPRAECNLQPGELVKVRSHAEILATVNRQRKNRGLQFDAEAVPYCGRIFRVRRRVQRIIDEQSGRMLHLSNDCVSLEGVVCQGIYSQKRRFCPRRIITYWREIWLERLE